MKWEIVERLKPWIEGCSDISLTGFGEALLHPEFSAVTKTFHSWNPYAKISMTTNLATLKDDHIETFFAIPFYVIAISINAANENTYHYIHKGNFKKTIQNLEILIKERRRRKSKRPILTLSFVVMQPNVSEIIDFMELANYIGVDFVGFYNGLFCELKKENAELLVAYHSTGEYVEKLKMTKELYNELRDVGPKIRQLAYKYKIGIGGTAIDFFDGKSKSVDEVVSLAKRKNRPVCPEPFYGAYINSVGEVSVCCHSWFKVVGDLRIQDTESIWNSLFYKDMRERMILAELPEFCRACINSMGGMKFLLLQRFPLE